MNKYIWIIISILLLMLTNKCDYKRAKANKELNYFDVPILKVMPNQLLSIFDSVLNIENTFQHHKYSNESKVCLLMIPNVNIRDTLQKIENKTGDFRIEMDVHHSESFFIVKEIKSSYIGVVVYKQHLFFIDKYFRTSKWFHVTTNVIKLKGIELAKDSIPLPPAPDGLSWLVRYDKGRFYFSSKESSLPHD